jgi:hypothetical protein
MNPVARLAAVVVVALPGVAGAQVRPGVPQLPPRPAAARPDTTVPDTTAQWSPADSIMQALLTKPGYTVTRYEGETVTFDAVSKALAIAAAAAQKAIVQRDSMRAVTDTQIVYDDRTNSVAVKGRFEIVLGPGQAPIKGSGTARYDLARRTGRLTNAKTTIDEQGERWFINSEISVPVAGDSTRGIQPRFYGLGGSLTSCDDSIPDYHFRLREIKRTEKTLVARPAVLYISDIPVMWLPFVFQDIRPGRRSGILSPSFGASDIVRNNPTYRRHVENIGYYWALSDYVDFATWLNWRSSAGADSTTDPGWYEINGEWKYNWLSRFLNGRLATAYMKERGGDNRFSVSWGHQQRFSTNRNFTSNVNYTSSTALQRRNTFLPAQAIATIVSSMALSDKIGPASLQIGGTQRQFPGRKQVERSAPSISISSTPIARGDWLLWTPSFSFSENATLHMDQPGPFSTRFVSDASGQLVRVDSLDRNQYSRTMTIGSPLRFFGLDLSQQVSIRDELADYPVEVTVFPDADSSKKELRVFSQVFKTTVDWNPSFSLPPIFQNRFKITPSVTLSNVDPGPYWVRSVTSGGKFVHQSKRLSYGVSAAPTIFGIWPGFGPFQRFRHSVSPTLSYSFAPPAKVSDEYLEAINQSKQVYLGSLAQSAVSFGLSHNIEAKVRSPQDTSSTEGAQKLKVLTMTFTPLSYDFERARKTGRKIAGLTTESFGSTLRSDLLPGFDLSVNYSLFQGSTMTDTAEFKPFLTSVSSRLSLSQTENPLTVITRLFGRAVPERSPPTTTGTRPEEATLTREIASQPIAGQAARGRQFVTPPTQGWQASINFSTTRPRPIRGDRIVDFDPRARCELFISQPFLHDQCVNSPTLDEPVLPPVAGAPGVRTPRQTSITGDTRFALTQKWAASWNTSYDFEQSKFAMHTVSLQRDLHDWRAIFAFTHSPNGNFAFNFFIALKPQPDLKFDYSRATVRAR